MKVIFFDNQLWGPITLKHLLKSHRDFISFQNKRSKEVDSCISISNNLPTQTFGIILVSHTVLAGSDMQSLSLAHSSIGAKLVKKSDEMGSHINFT